MAKPISLEAQAILDSLRKTGQWETPGGIVQIQWLSDEGKGFIDVKNVAGVEGRKGYYQLLKRVLPQLDIIAELPAEWQFNPDKGKKGRIYQMLGPKLKGNLTPNPDMPNNALTWNTKPKPVQQIMGIQKKTPKVSNVEVVIHPKGSIIDSNNLRDPLQQDIDQGLPTSKQEAVNRGINVYQDENGKTWKLRYKKRKKTETFNGKEYSFEREGWETWKQGKRTHHQNRRTNWKNKLLTKQDYYDYADKNGIDRSIADQKYNQNQLRLKSRQLRSGKDTPWIIEHLNPQSNPKGGVEHWRNNVLWTSEVNNPKSDIIPSTEALKAAGVPLSKEDALRLDFTDDPGVPTKEARRIILEDIQSQLKGGNPKRARFIRRAIGATATATAGLVSSPLKTLAAIPDVVPATYAFDALSLGATHLDKWGTQQLPDDHVYKSGATKQQALDWLNRQIGADVVGLEPTGIGNIPAVLNQQLDPRETEEQKRARGEQAIENVSIMQQHGMNPFF